MLGLENSPSHYNGNVGDLVVVNALYINYLIRLFNDASLITSITTICCRTPLLCPDFLTRIQSLVLV